MRKVHRVMKHDLIDHHRPKLGTAFGCLGARVPRDIEPDQSMHVIPCKKGMSVMPSLDDIGPFMVPQKYAHLLEGAKGDDSSSVWIFADRDFKTGGIAPKLLLDCTSKTHGVIGPSERMPLDTYQDALANTQREWIVLDVKS